MSPVRVGGQKGGGEDCECVHVCVCVCECVGVCVWVYVRGCVRETENVR